MYYIIDLARMYAETSIRASLNVTNKAIISRETIPLEYIIATLTVKTSALNIADNIAWQRVVSDSSDRILNFR